MCYLYIVVFIHCGVQGKPINSSQKCTHHAKWEVVDSERITEDVTGACKRQEDNIKKGTILLHKQQELRDMEHVLK